MTEIPTDEGKLYLATILDLFSRKLLTSPTAEHPGAELAGDVIKMAAAVQAGRTVIDGAIFHTDRNLTYTAKNFTKYAAGWELCSRWSGSGRVPITPPRKPSSRRSSMRCCPASFPHPRQIPRCRRPLVPGLLQLQTAAQLSRVAGEYESIAAI